MPISAERAQARSARRSAATSHDVDTGGGGVTRTPWFQRTSGFGSFDMRTRRRWSEFCALSPPRKPDAQRSLPGPSTFPKLGRPARWGGGYARLQNPINKSAYSPRTEVCRATRRKYEPAKRSGADMRRGKLSSYPRIRSSLTLARCSATFALCSTAIVLCSAAIALCSAAIALCSAAVVRAKQTSHWA